MKFSRIGHHRATQRKTQAFLLEKYMKSLHSFYDDTESLPFQKQLSGGVL